MLGLTFLQSKDWSHNEEEYCQGHRPAPSSRRESQNEEGKEIGIEAKDQEPLAGRHAEDQDLQLEVSREHRKRHGRHSAAARPWDRHHAGQHQSGLLPLHIFAYASTDLLLRLNHCITALFSRESVSQGITNQLKSTGARLGYAGQYMPSQAHA